jgi:hypothetical protein
MPDTAEHTRSGTVVALAGRRIDAPDAEEPRFPLERVPEVRAELVTLLDPTRVHALVCSAACGADLLALDVAGEAGIERHVVLPFHHATFRRTSVVDRPGDWGPLFDRVLEEVGESGHLEIGGGDPNDKEVYPAANEAIIEAASKVVERTRHGSGMSRTAVVVWEGASYGSDDVTEDFRKRAQHAGFDVRVVLTR